jgi:hypothetical protein
MSGLYIAFWRGRASGGELNDMPQKSFMTRFIIAFILIFSGIANATIVERLSLEEMTKKASSIAVGKVRSSRTFWSGNLILTTYTFDVQEMIKGQASRSIELTTVGGAVGDTTLFVAGMASFRSGEDAVVFVERSGQFSTVLGLAQGKFSVDRGEVSNELSGLEFSDGKGGRPLKMPLDDFKKRLRSIISNQP